VLIYLDSNVVIYLIEAQPVWGPKAAARIGALRADGDTMAVSDLTRLESRVGPLAAKDGATLSQFDAFFAAADVQVLPMTAAVFDRATMIRAQHRFKLADSLHLACAAESGCDRFLTNDARLSKFSDIVVEVLP
jgi:predicted nucleic acid-binding protein